MLIKISLVFLLGVLSMTEAAHADNFRCPNGSIVSTGDSISVVALKCDSPSFASRREGAIESDRGKHIYIEVQEWTFNEGPNRLLHFLIFRNGVLTEVRSGEYGK
jgi:hypothetical protein